MGCIDLTKTTKDNSGISLNVYVGIEYYVDDPEPRVNDVVVFRKHESALEWQKKAHNRDIHEAILE